MALSAASHYVCDILVYFILQQGLQKFLGDNSADYEINIFH